MSTEQLKNARNASIAGAALGLLAASLKSRTLAFAAGGCAAAAARYVAEAGEPQGRHEDVIIANAASAAIPGVATKIDDRPLPDINLVELEKLTSAKTELHVPELQVLEKPATPMVPAGPAPVVLDLTTGDPEFVTPGDEDVRDPATGLFNEKYFNVALENRISAARRQLRPVAVALLSLVIDGHEPVPGEAAKAADSVRSVLREADQAFRLDDGRFALVLEDTPENGAVWTVERLRRAMIGDREAIRAAGGRDPKVGEESLRVHAGVACYPAHGFEAEEVIRLAESAFGEATDWPGDRIEVAASAVD